MFKNIFTKTMYEKRWTMLLWFIGVAAMTTLTLVFYTSFKQGGFDEILKNAPKSLKGLLGNTASLKTVPGYVSQEIFNLRIPMLVLIMGVILFSGLMGADENDGTLQSLLAQPVSRLKVFAQKFIAGALVTFVVCLGAIAGAWIALLLIHESMSSLRLFQATVGAWLLVMLFGSLAYALSAITGKRGLSGGVTGFLAFGMYLITSLKPNVSALNSVERLSPFHYYNQPATAVAGLSTRNVIVMSSVIIICLIISLLVFIRRDIYQR